ncbi:hypothetical protein DL770_003179 [Monosporascus sp. CRB-9-2]|nr:hypothetical protein DL770_003179 [Monosporascus sp. CRB-9-2]
MYGYAGQQDYQKPPPSGLDTYGYPITVEVRGKHDILGVDSNVCTHGYNRAPPPPPSGMQQFGHGAPEAYAFQYSTCQGRRKALLIGINYFGQDGELRGCINDVRNVSTFLAETYGYKIEDMVILTDAQQQPLDQTDDLDGDEEDGSDEVIYLVDFKQAGHTVDGEMHRILVKPLPQAADVTIANQAIDAMSYAFISALRANPQQSYVQVLNSFKDVLRDKLRPTAAVAQQSPNRPDQRTQPLPDIHS